MSNDPLDLLVLLYKNRDLGDSLDEILDALITRHNRAAVGDPVDQLPPDWGRYYDYAEQRRMNAAWRDELRKRRAEDERLLKLRHADPPLPD